MKREITPHKGDRVARIGVRATEQTKQLLRQVAKARGRTEADVIDELIRQAAENLGIVAPS